MRKLEWAMALLVLAASCAVLAHAPATAQTAAARPNALVEFPAKDSATLTVTTPAWQNGGDIPFANTQFRTNTFPGLNWSAGPAGTKSYAVIMQDTDAVSRGAPILHWTLYNIPAGVTKLEPSMAPTNIPAGSSYGPNARGGAQPYMGPRPPPGAPHHYHLQVFALDTVLNADPALTYDGLTGQMKDHILASGEVVGLGSFDPDAPPPPPRQPRPAAN